MLLQPYINPSGPDPEQRENINLYFYFHTSLYKFKLIFYFNTIFRNARGGKG